MGDSFATFGIAAHAALALYLLAFARIDLDRVALIYRKAALGTLWSIPVLAIIAWLVSQLGSPSPGRYAAILLGISLVMVVAVSLAHARDELIPRHSAVELILLNVAILFAAPSNPFAKYLLIPFPRELYGFLGYWLLLVIELWPSWLVLAMVRKGGPHDPRLKLLLAGWATLAWLVLTAPAAWTALQSFDASSPLAYAGSLVNSFVVIHGVFLALTLLRTRESTLVKAPDAPAEGPAAFLVSRVALGTQRLGVLLGIAAAYYVSLRLLAPAFGRAPELVGIALGILVVFGNLLRQLTELGSAEDRMEADLDVGDEVLERIWEKRKAWPLPAIAIGMLAIHQNSGNVGFSQDRSFVWFVELWALSALAILWFVGLWILWIVLDALRVGGRRWSGGARASTFAVGLVALVAWRVGNVPPADAFEQPASVQAVELPSPKFEVASMSPRAGFRVGERVVYLGPASARLFGQSGRALFVEGVGNRRPLCGDGENRNGKVAFTHFQILDEKRVECTTIRERPGAQPETVVRVEGLIEGMGGVSVGLTAAKVLPDGSLVPIRADYREVAEGEAGLAGQCTLESYPGPHVRCGDRSAPLPVASGAPKWPAPSAWHIAPVRKRVEITTKFLKVLCLPAQVDGTLAFEREAARWPAVVLVRLDSRPGQPLVVDSAYDEGATCESVALGNHRLWLRASKFTERRTFWEGIALDLARPTLRREVRPDEGTPASRCQLVDFKGTAAVDCGTGPFYVGKNWFATDLPPVQIDGDYVSLLCFPLQTIGPVLGGGTGRVTGIAVLRLDDPLIGDRWIETKTGWAARCDNVDFDDRGLPVLRVEGAKDDHFSSSIYPRF